MSEIQQDGLPLTRRNWAMVVIALGMTMAVLAVTIADTLAIGHYDHSSAGRAFDGSLQCRFTGGIGLMIFGAALLLLAMMPAHPSHIDIIWRMFLGAIGFGLFITPTIVRLGTHRYVRLFPRTVSDELLE